MAHDDYDDHGTWLEVLMLPFTLVACVIRLLWLPAMWVVGFGIGLCLAPFIILSMALKLVFGRSHLGSVPSTMIILADCSATWLLRDFFLVGMVLRLATVKLFATMERASRYDPIACVLAEE